jgi:hypothetical protein
MHEAVPAPAALVRVASMQPVFVVVPFAPEEFTQAAPTVAALIAEPPCIAAAPTEGPMRAVPWARLRLVPLRTVLPHIRITTDNAGIIRIRPVTRLGSRCSGTAPLKSKPRFGGACEIARHQV